MRTLLYCWLISFSLGVYPTGLAASERLKLVERYAQTMLAAAQDSYSGQNTPLLANGINMIDGSPLLWKNADGTDNILSNFSAQQNFMRLLVGLSELTGKPEYKEQAKANVRYYFDHYQDPVGGLLFWGGHRFIDLNTLEPLGVGDKNMVHELKNGYPFYDLMYDVNPAATTRLIEGIWNAHVYNWTEMETSRHGSYDKPIGLLWAHQKTQLEPWYETPGLSFLNASNDLIYAASVLARRDKKPVALAWGEHLAFQYVYPRDKNTRLGVYQFTKALQRETTTDDSNTHSKFGDRALRQFGPEFGPNALEGNMMLRGRTSTIYSENALMQLQLAKELGKQGENFHNWTVDGLTAFAQHAYDPKTGMLRPMIADGQDLSNYVLPRDGYYGKKGTVLSQYKADSKFLLSFARAYALVPSDYLWTVIQGIAKSEDLGDVGSKAGQNMALHMGTKNRDPFAIFTLITLYEASGNRNYLLLAEKVADNLVARHYVDGFFLDAPDSLWANIDSIHPYALLSLEAALAGKSQAIAPFMNGAGFTEGEYRLNDGTLRISTTDQHIFTLRKGQALGATRNSPHVTVNS